MASDIVQTQASINRQREAADFVFPLKVKENNKEIPLSPKVERLLKIVEETPDVKIVISSSQYLMAT